MTTAQVLLNREIEPVDSFNTVVMAGESLARQQMLVETIGQTIAKYEVQPVYRAGTLSARLAIAQSLNN